MPLRIADYVLAGDLRNTRRNCVHGWIEFAPDYGVRIELTGNFSGQLAGKHIRFSMPHRAADKACEPGSFPEYIEELADRQIGVVQTMELRKATVPALPIDDFLRLSEADRTLNMVEKDCLYLEWSSQDGAVISELIEPVLEIIDDEVESGQMRSIDGVEFLGAALNDPHFSEVAELILGQTMAALNDEEDEDDDPDEDDRDGNDDEDDESEDEEDDDLDGDDDGHDDDDPYGLFDADLEQNVAESLGGESSEGELTFDGNVGGARSWEEVIPGISPDTVEMYEQYDEIFEGKKDEPISYLFPTTLQLPKPERVTSEEEAEGLVKAILSQLALLSVALDVCEHFTMQQTYRLLMQEILPTAKVHPNLAASEMVQHYATSDFCEQCDAEFEAEYRASRAEGLTDEESDEELDELDDELDGLNDDEDDEDDSSRQ